MKNLELFYPSFTKKALTFTIDDGNMAYDKKLLSILAPVGIKGTFNLCSHIHLGKEDETREFYRGYDVANHMKYHPLVNYDGVDYPISYEPFDPDTADEAFVYRVDGSDVFFWLHRPNGWRQMVFEKDFLRFIEDGKKELDAIFGEGTVRDFVWPYCEQDNAAARDLIRRTHRSARKTGPTLDTTGFAIPADKYAWSYNAYDMNLLEVMEKYEAYPDDGELKFFAFGVHSIDFERDEKWGDLEAFAKKYGNRPDTYWYATVGEIFDYEEAIDLLKVTDGYVENPSEADVYVSVNGERVILPPHTRISF